jgi:hypothetical protein
VDNRIASYLQSGALPRRAKGNGPDVSCRPLPQPDPTKIKALQTPQGLPRPDLRQLLRQR